MEAERLPEPSMTYSISQSQQVLLIFQILTREKTVSHPAKVQLRFRTIAKPKVSQVTSLYLLGRNPLPRKPEPVASSD